MADVDPAVQHVLNETKAGEDEHDLRCRRYDNSYDIYRASGRPRTSSWQSKLRVKYGMQVIDTAMVNMAQAKPRCRVLPRTPIYEEQAKGFQHVFDYYVERDTLVQKVPLTIQQALIYGVAVGKNHWLYKTGMRTSRRHGIDESTGQPASIAEHTPVIFRDGPSFEPWDIYDAWWEPNARSVQDAAWVALRAWLTKDQLIRDACTAKGPHDPHECNGIYHNVELLLQTGEAQARRSTAQEQALGGVANLRKGRFKIVEYWRDDRITVLGNDQVLLRDEDNPHWHGQKPIVVASCRPDLFRIQGIPETELVSDLQDALWTVENMRMDNLHLTVMRGFTYREGGVIDPNALELMPRFKWPVTDHDDVKMVETQQLPPEAYEEEQQLLSRLRDVTGITPYISGAGTDQIDQNTATGISILNSAASALLRFKASQLQYGIWQPTFHQWGSDIQQFMTEPVWVRLAGPGSAFAFQQVTQDEVVGEFDFILEGTDESLSKAQERQEALALLNAFAPLAATGIVNFKPLLERVALAYGFTNPEQLLQAPQQPAAPGPQAPVGQILGPRLGTPFLGQTLGNGQPLPLGVNRGGQ